MCGFIGLTTNKLYRHEVMWKMLEQIPMSRLGLLAKVKWSSGAGRDGMEGGRGL